MGQCSSSISRRRGWVVRTALGVALVAAVASLGAGRLGSVTLLDGSTYDGTVTETEHAVVIRSAQGVEIRVGKERVKAIEYREEADLEFARRLRDLDSQDVEGRVVLAKFAMEQKRPDLAKGVLLEALRLDPNHHEASALYAAARSQVEMERRKAEREAAGHSTLPVPAAPPAVAGVAVEQDPPAEGGGGGGRRLVRPTLDTDGVNYIRQTELGRDETNIAIRFENNAQKRLAEYKGMTVADLRKNTPLQQLLLVRGDAGAAEILKDIRVVADPLGLAEFRKIQPLILSGCANSGCHGGPMAGRFWLHAPAANDATTYTNFYLLATGKAPVVRQGERTAVRRLIDRTNPDQSLLLQFALAGSQFPHPVVPNFKPIFRSAEDPRFENLRKWLNSTLVMLDEEAAYRGLRLPGTEPEPAPAPQAPAAPAQSAPGAEAPPAAPGAPATQPATRPGGFAPVPRR